MLEILNNPKKRWRRLLKTEPIPLVTFHTNSLMKYCSDKIEHIEKRFRKTNIYYALICIRT